jgi:hypothetical protein
MIVMQDAVYAEGRANIVFEKLGILFNSLKEKPF